MVDAEQQERITLETRSRIENLLKYNPQYEQYLLGFLFTWVEMPVTRNGVKVHAEPKKFYVQS